MCSGNREGGTDLRGHAEGEFDRTEGPWGMGGEGEGGVWVGSVVVLAWWPGEMALPSQRPGARWRGSGQVQRAGCVRRVLPRP